MSRIGKMPVPVPSGVTVNIQDHTVSVKGPKGELTRSFSPDIELSLQDGQVVLSRSSEEPQARALHGLTRALVANMVTGVSQGYRKTLEVEGTGYRVDTRGDSLVLIVGYSHPVELPPPPGIKFTVEKGNKVFHIDGTDKELVGEIAAKIRAVRKPEPYKGKGIRYSNERIRRKAGKAGKAGK